MTRYVTALLVTAALLLVPLHPHRASAHAPHPAPPGPAAPTSVQEQAAQHHARPVERRAKPQVRPPKPVVHRAVHTLGTTPRGLAAWLASPTARAVRACESHGVYTTVSHSGYLGAWQADAGFWRHYGGDPAYLSLPDVGGHLRFLAPPAMQDQVAYRGWLARGWQPWISDWLNGCVQRGGW